MTVPVESIVRSELTPFVKRIRKVLDKGFQAYLAKRGSGNMFRRTDSADIFDCVIQAAIAEFNGKPGIKIFSPGATARFLFNGQILVRFKKATRRGKGQNIDTAANDNFLNPAIPFPDAPHAMKVEICWKVSALGTSYTDVYVTARKGKGALWSYEMPGGAQEVIKFPKPAAAPPQRRRIARLKDTSKTKKKNRDAS
jgi:hypothetical protein